MDNHTPEQKKEYEGIKRKDTEIELILHKETKYKIEFFCGSEFWHKKLLREHSRNRHERRVLEIENTKKHRT